MEPRDLVLRREIYRLVVTMGRAPLTAELAGALGRGVDDVAGGLRRLHDAHAVVLHEASGEIRMANPFSAVPTPHRVEAGGRWWFANCAWDAIGICAALHVDGRVETSCPDCGEAVSFAVVDQRPDDESLLFHCLVPAKRWWDDIGFT